MSTRAQIPRQASPNKSQATIPGQRQAPTIQPPRFAPELPTQPQKKGSSHGFSDVDMLPKDSLKEFTAHSPHGGNAVFCHEMVNNSARVVAQGKYQEIIHDSPVRIVQRERLEGMFGGTAQQKGNSKEGEIPPIRTKENRTGMPDHLKAGIENLSGVSMDDLRVHYNSSKPAHLEALAYAQGTDIHVGPGQEQHLPHEAWHVAQQKQGRVKPTMQAQGVSINDDEGLEHEADVMGAKAMQMRRSEKNAFEFSIHQRNRAIIRVSRTRNQIQSGSMPVQRLPADATDYVDLHHLVLPANGGYRARMKRYIDNTANPVARRNGLRNAWNLNRAPGHVSIIPLPADLEVALAPVANRRQVLLNLWNHGSPTEQALAANRAANPVNLAESTTAAAIGHDTNGQNQLQPRLNALGAAAPLYLTLGLYNRNQYWTAQRNAAFIQHIINTDTFTAVEIASNWIRGALGTPALDNDNAAQQDWIGRQGGTLAGEVRQLLQNGFTYRNGHLERP